MRRPATSTATWVRLTSRQTVGRQDQRREADQRREVKPSTTRSAASRGCVRRPRRSSRRAPQRSAAPRPRAIPTPQGETTSRRGPIHTRQSACRRTPLARPPHRQPAKVVRRGSGPSTTRPARRSWQELDQRCQRPTARDPQQLRWDAGRRGPAERSRSNASRSSSWGRACSRASVRASGCGGSHSMLARPVRDRLSKGRRCRSPSARRADRPAPTASPAPTGAERPWRLGVGGSAGGQRCWSSLALLGRMIARGASSRS